MCSPVWESLLDDVLVFLFVFCHGVFLYQMSLLFFSHSERFSLDGFLSLCTRVNVILMKVRFPASTVNDITLLHRVIGVCLRGESMFSRVCLAGTVNMTF